MKIHLFATSLIAAGVLFAAPGAIAQTQQPVAGPAADGSPGWRAYQGTELPVGRNVVGPDGSVTVMPRAPRPVQAASAAPAPPPGRYPFCMHSVICGRIGGPSQQQAWRVLWNQSPNYRFSYPLQIPAGDGGTPGAAVDSKGNVWVTQRSPRGSPQLFKFDAQGRLLITVPPSVTGYQEKAHGMTIDAQDNVWFIDETGATVMAVNPDGKLVRTIGIKDRPGDWDEARNQHLLWQPVSIAFAPNGDMFIGEGHGNESPNDVDSPDPANNNGAARILHFDANGRFVGQWYGNDLGPGRFDQTHGLAIDPRNGDVWIGDREQYRIVIYNSVGKFLRTIQMRNLTCAIAFDRNGEPWVATGMDGQVLRIDRSGKVLEAVGGGHGLDKGMFVESNYFAFDRNGALYVGDTGIGRVAKISPSRS